MRCLQEMCAHWTGSGCACEVLDLHPIDLEHGAVRARPPSRTEKFLTVRQRIEALPPDGATKSRDYGRGYAQAIRDVLSIMDGKAGSE